MLPLLTPLASSNVMTLILTPPASLVSQKRMMRASAIHGLAGMAAIMASTYKAYLGEGLPEPVNSWLQKFKIPHPGRVRIALLSA